MKYRISFSIEVDIVPVLEAVEEDEPIHPREFLGPDTFDEFMTNHRTSVSEMRDAGIGGRSAIRCSLCAQDGITTIGFNAATHPYHDGLIEPPEE